MKKKCTKILSSLVVGKRRVSDYYNNGCSIFTHYYRHLPLYYQKL